MQGMKDFNTELKQRAERTSINVDGRQRKVKRRKSNTAEGLARRKESLWADT